ncbi:tail tape measure protein [Zavarzinia aquatilis]|uniref:Tail tape measure protein n=1 Tax=Zavarzinia aquatilis TaxID=2211142 RepID=A0A317EC54_9PROT|nr:tail tape measure protein [Zavarzinia aquatilis]PWR22755.1 tail tape measure protein [Zavarzinia aquatilis]
MPVIERLSVELAAELSPLRDAFAEAERMAGQAAGDLATALAGEAGGGGFDLLATGVETVSRTIRKSLVDALSGAEVEWDDVLSRMVLRLSDLAVDRSLSAALGSLTGDSGGSAGGGAGGAWGGDLLSLIGGLFGGFRASGGPVAAGRAYVVGEQGPELFLPEGAGSIEPGLASAAAAMPRVTVNISTPDIEGFRRSQGQVSAAITRALGAARRYA